MSPHEQTSEDVLAARLAMIAQYILVVVFGLLPLFFIPSVATPFLYSKILFVIVGVFLSIILYCFASLRRGTVSLQLPWVPALLWILALIALVSALVSGDIRDALIGEIFEVHTTAFVILMALSASAVLLLGANKEAIMRFFMFLAGSTLILLVFHILRLIFGADFLSFGLFSGDATFSPLGGWNDLAIFFGLAVILSLVAFEQLRLTTLGQVFFGLVVVAALVMLAVINFFAVWVILGLVSLVVLVYALTKDRFSGRLSIDTKERFSLVSISTSLLVLIASLVFVLGGNGVGNTLTKLSGVNYLEVRPSFSATTAIAKQVYDSEPLFGAGPNRFSDTWRQFKNPSINESIFWNTDFMAGFGYIPTLFVTTGIVGGIAWLAFLILYVFLGLRMLLRTTINDRLWYFIGTVSFVGGLYIWGMSSIYVPGPVLLLIAAVCTGLMSVSYHALMHTKVYEVHSYGNRRIGFVFILFFLVLFIGLMGTLYMLGRHYSAVYTFNTASLLAAEGASLDEIEAKTIEAYNLSKDDIYVRTLAEYQLRRMEALLGVAEPTEEQKQQFNTALTNAVSAAQIALAGDSTDPRNISMIGRVYATLVPIKIEGAYERSVESLKRAQELDPHNPVRLLALGQLAFMAGREEEARSYIAKAIEMKSNYSDALFSLAQMDIAVGNTEAAITASRAITVLEPQNPMRFFQLGVLLFSAKQYAEAATALERAIALTKDYANAHFYLALAYDMLGRKEESREHLDTILALNPGNQLIIDLLARLDRGEALLETPGAQTALPESSTVNTDDGSVTTSTAPDTPLVSPVNTPGETSAEESAE